MIQVETKVKIPFLWGKKVFSKKNWSQVNLILGPNGSGKTLLAESLAVQFADAGYKITYLNSERKLDLDYLDFLYREEKIRNRVELILSRMFAKSIKFIKKENQIIPMVINKARNVEYSLQEDECHGFKKILSLLLALYNPKNQCLIIDEPEMHLHPQFQVFFMSEIRRVSRDYPDRIFFLISHSPFFIDLVYPEDLIGVVVCHVNREPTFIEHFSKKDDILFRRFLPRFNTYHKQFFFSDNQVFVEGYTDQQVFSLLMSRLEEKFYAVNTGVIDVGGKDELGVFFKVCSLLGTNAKIITDLDSLFCGKLCDELCADSRPRKWLIKQSDKQEEFFKKIFSFEDSFSEDEEDLFDEKEIGDLENINEEKKNFVLENKISLKKLIRKLEEKIAKLGFAVCQMEMLLPLPMRLYQNKITYFYEERINPEDLDTYKVVVLQGLYNNEEFLIRYLPEEIADEIPLIKNLASIIFAAIEAANVYILQKGCIEHYYVTNKVQYMPISGKDKLFHEEREHILNSSTDIFFKDYDYLIGILQKACSQL